MVPTLNNLISIGYNKNLKVLLSDPILVPKYCEIYSRLQSSSNKNVEYIGEGLYKHTRVTRFTL